ncbi:helix-turn-helix domain-containing protein [Streptosporangium saharense]|uniref:helix-turn-helix domain-containing protein n=1 Tax=Streptosporangium saharense TaxID=1706840 RepID=UPI003328667D
MPDLRPSKAARRALGVRLRDLRLDAGLTGAELSRLAGMHPSKVSRIEHGVQAPSENDLKVWASVCGVEDRLAELVAAGREVEQTWIEYRRELRLGQKRIQSRALGVYQRADRARIYESLHVPGILQTRGYAVAQFTLHARHHGLPIGDAEAAADIRLGTQRLLYIGSPRFSFLLEANVLHTNVGGVAIMNEQLDFLQHVTGLPGVAFGVLPLGRERTLFPGEGFYLFDDREVRQELWSGAMRTSRPDEIAYFARSFGALHRQAVYGEAARDAIEEARRRLHAR